MIIVDMITASFCEKIVYHCNMLGLKPFDPLDPLSLKEHCVKLLFSLSQTAFIVYGSYNFFIKHQSKIIKARGTQKYIDVAEAMMQFTKKIKLKTIKAVESILLTNFFGDIDKPQTIEIIEGKFVYHTVSRAEMKESKRNGKNLKVIETDDCVSYIYDKNYVKSVGTENVDIKKAIASYYMDLGNKERYIYYIDVNSNIGKDAALRNVARLHALKAAQAAICMSIISTNMSMMNMRRF